MLCHLERASENGNLATCGTSGRPLSARACLVQLLTAYVDATDEPLLDEVAVLEPSQVDALLGAVAAFQVHPSSEPPLEPPTGLPVSFDTLYDDQTALFDVVSAAPLPTLRTLFLASVNCLRLLNAREKGEYFSLARPL